MNFILPGLYEHYDVNIILASLVRNQPEIFRDNVKIGAVYGNFQFSCWDGGRVFGSYYHANKELIEQLREIYGELGVPMRLAFTSSQVSEIDCYSRFDNLVLKLLENDKNEVVVGSTILEDYIRENYPKYTFISSTTKCLTKAEDFLNEVDSGRYKMVCLDYNLNKNKQLLDSIDNEKRDKFEFLINAICPPGCPNRKQHYYANSIFGLSYGKVYYMRECPISGSILYPNNYKNNFTPEEVEEYSKNGYVNFKLEGRTLSRYEVIANFVKFAVKPEYQLATISNILSYCDNFDLNNCLKKNYLIF